MYFYKSFFSIVSICLTGLFIIGCSEQENDSANVSSNRYQIVCTVGMITDIAKNVAGEYAQVENVIGEGVDPHVYKPTRGDVVRLTQADVVFYNGLLLEGKMTDILESVATSGKKVKAVTEAILEDTDYLVDKPDGSGRTDPHVWMDVSGWQRAVLVVLATLIDFDPSNTEIYKSNASAYIEKLSALDAYVKAAMSTIPESQRVLVTAHDAFQYMGRAYGIEVRGVQGVSTESESGVHDLEELVDFIVGRKIPAIFFETSVADKNVRALVEGARARGHDVLIGGSLYSDAMGQSGSYEGTYIGMIDHNVTTIVNALGGVAEGFR
jgi:manganese/zinc/iron transport system substrate-binding protein